MPNKSSLAVQNEGMQNMRTWHGKINRKRLDNRMQHISHGKYIYVITMNFSFANTIDLLNEFIVYFAITVSNVKSLNN